jgi:hypothetical protein
MSTKYLIPWSGGLDSTFLVRKLLLDGHSVTTCYIDLMNNNDKTEMELAARESIKRNFVAFGDRFKDLGVIGRFRLEHTKDSAWISQPQIFILFLSFISNSYDSIAFGYVVNDCAISFLEDLKSLWVSYSGFGHLSEIKFPLIKWEKKEMEMPKEFLDHVVWCENAKREATHFGYTPCGECAPCCRAIKVDFLKYRFKRAEIK